MMQTAKPNPPMAPSRLTTKFIFIAMILAILTVIVFSVNNAFRSFHAGSLPQGTAVITQNVLEDKYGLRVNLIAVTAAGGFVDLRLKIVDGEKAKLLLADSNNFPTLFTKDGVTLNAPADTKSQEIEFITGGNLFIMYPNSAKAIRVGSPVTILFGDTAIEPVSTR